jgi:hypothetical protein
MLQGTVPGNNVEHAAVTWRLIAEARTLMSGSGKVSRDSKDLIPVYEMAIPLPPLKPGVTQELSVEIVHIRAVGTDAVQYPIYVFSREPFAARERWLKRLRIKLFDPEGGTADLFDAENIPYNRLLDLAAIEAVDNGVLLVGEDVSWAEQRLLPESLLQAAQRGVTVLCLAPSEGELPLPFGEIRANGLPSRLVFGRADFLRGFDKRFDLLPGRSRLSIVPLRDRMALRADDDEGEWTWTDIRYPTENREGRLALCTWGIVSQWEVSPVYRYLLADILQDLHDESLPEEAKTNVTNQN